MVKDRSTHFTRAIHADATPAPAPALALGGGPPAAPQARISMRDLLLKLLPGFLPLLVYVLAESIWGEIVGLSVAIAFGVLEFGFIWLRERRADWLACMDTLLLVLMGAISLAFSDPVFLRIKPALIEGLMAVLLGISAFGTRNLVLGRMLREMKAAGLVNIAAEARMSAMLAAMFWLILLHAGLTVAAALWASKEIWIFVSGALLFIMFGALTVGILLRTLLQRRRQARAALKSRP